MMRICLFTLTVGLLLLGANAAGASAQTAPTMGERTPLTSPQLPPHQPGTDTNVERKTTGLSSVVTVVGSLALVLGVFFLGLWLMRKSTPAGFGALPAEAFESLGRARLTARQNVQLLRCGNKVLLVAVGATSAETLTEITDPDEIERLVETCRRPQRGGAAAAFRQVFSRGEGRNEG